MKIIIIWKEINFKNSNKHKLAIFLQSNERTNAFHSFHFHSSFNAYLYAETGGWAEAGSGVDLNVFERDRKPLEWKIKKQMETNWINQ